MTTSLIDRVRKLLSDEKKELGGNFDRTFDPGRGNDVVELNKYFRIELGRAPISTLEERECLIDDLDEGVWLRYFEHHILPTLVRFNLPRG